MLFDFADIESYDPAGNFYPQESDACGWRAYWWMLARLAGWDGVSSTCG